ncbi:DUF808 domain-containing protein [Vibrio sp. SS-MA-C1-2]|uniref:DUF808 domain-containing protein n=1 Tax=Vibrio sp. SS-MA-C1-2 TaxID=2908646 RepID=UPI001F47474C|nr:DUF808 domain-containing protein [Vibrio sp. SS-MA-C1-2]UJF16885.1 DUF808 domain-containing protein [Vibrio sp. SS-MA-C1-2]
MAGLSLLTLLDDIAAVLDDVSLMTKAAAKKSAGVLGDDLALNAQQMADIRAERELPVVWGVAKGSFRNKLILVPAALLISYFAPFLISWLLLLGGLYLCFEGVEAIIEKFFPHVENDGDKRVSYSDDNYPEFEKAKIQAAVRTDFVLSTEIIVIVLGTVEGHSLVTQLIVLSIMATLMTVGVYGFVAAIVKLDDVGFFLLKKDKLKRNAFYHTIGAGLVAAAPRLMKLLALVGTIAMFLVGGGIIVHTVPWLAEQLKTLDTLLSIPASVVPVFDYILHGILGVFVGLVLVGIFTLVKRIKK